jgi:hypothetical protein
MSAVTQGIKRRLDGIDQFRDGTYCWLDDILSDNGLPLINSHEGGLDSDYIGFLYEMAELLERINDGVNNDRDAEVRFIERQLTAVLAQGKRQWSVSK